MPPKEKVSRVNVTDAAFEMTREYGFGSVTARKLADRLGCSTQPIFRAYENMEELRTEIFYKSAQFFCDDILSRKARTQPKYLTVALSYIDLSTKEKNMFELISGIDDFGTQTIQEFVKQEEFVSIIKDLPGMEKRSYEERESVFLMLWMFVHGLANLIAAGRVKLSDREIKALIIRAYEGFST